VLPQGRLVGARSIIELRLPPHRQTGEIERFLAQVREPEAGAAGSAA
jgi:hypothetical protein